MQGFCHQLQQNIQKTQEHTKQVQYLKKKHSLLKKRYVPFTKLFPNVDIKHVVNIADVCFLNEDSLRNPESSQETLLKTLYHYKMISKVTLNSSFVNIELKKNADNYLPPQYFIQRLRSFGDKQMANIAEHLQSIYKQFTKIKQSACTRNQKAFSKDGQQFLLQNFIRSMEGKKYFIYFSEITPQKINMKNIVFSVSLLQALGCNLKNIAMDFLKYRHVFFEVFTAKNYKNFAEGCLQNFSKIQSILMSNQYITQEEKKQLTSITYFDEIIRKKQGNQGIYQEVSKAKVLWFSPHPSICCFQILDLDQTEGVKLNKKRKIHFQETKPAHQIQELKKIGIDGSLLKIQDNQDQKQSSYKRGYQSKFSCNKNELIQTKKEDFYLKQNPQNKIFQEKEGQI